MKIEIKTKHVDGDHLVREYVERKVQFALNRFEKRIARVAVHVEDESPASNQCGGLCRIEVETVPRGSVFVSAHGESAFDCVLQGVRKMEQALKHQFDRKRSAGRSRHQKAKQAS